MDTATYTFKPTTFGINIQLFRDGRFYWIGTTSFEADHCLWKPGDTVQPFTLSLVVDHVEGNDVFCHAKGTPTPTTDDVRERIAHLRKLEATSNHAPCLPD